MCDMSSSSLIFGTNGALISFRNNFSKSIVVKNACSLTSWKSLSAPSLFWQSFCSSLKKWYCTRIRRDETYWEIHTRTEHLHENGIFHFTRRGKQLSYNPPILYSPKKNGFVRMLTFCSRSRQEGDMVWGTTSRWCKMRSYISFLSRL